MTFPTRKPTKEQAKALAEGRVWIRAHGPPALVLGISLVGTVVVREAEGGPNISWDLDKFLDTFTPEDAGKTP